MKDVLHKEKAVVLISIVHSLGTLLYKNEELMDHLISAILKKETEQQIMANQLSSVILSCAYLDYLPPALEGMLFNIVQHIEASPDVDSRTWLNTVWALVLLGKAAPTHVSSVLKDSFIETLKGI